MAILFGFIGLQGNPILIFIALFVWIGAGQEATTAQMKSALAGIPLRRAMLTHFRTLTPTSTLGEAVDFLLTGSQQDFPVVANGRIEGMLTRSDLVKALARSGRTASVADHMTLECPTAEPSEMLEAVLGRLQGRDCHTHTGARGWCSHRSGHHGQCGRVPDDSSRGTGTFVIARSSIKPQGSVRLS